MKDQYFGDFGDYQKVSLLRLLRAQGLDVLVHWMKTEDDGSTDGKHITYLQKPGTWREFEPEVFDFLKTKIDSGTRRLSHIEESTYGSDIEFLTEYIEESCSREAAMRQLLNSSADVVLFDPDNGIEVASTTKKTVHKYVMWDELVQAYEAGKSVIIYQHFSRSNRESFIRDKAREIQKRVSCPVTSLHVRHSVYFFLAQPTHAKELEAAIAKFSRIWKDLGVIRTH